MFNRAQVAVRLIEALTAHAGAGGGLYTAPMTLTRFARSRVLSALLIPGFLGSAAQAADLFSLPADYYNRFGGIEGVFDTNASKYGVRAFPLPIKADIRILFVNHPNYNEYGLTSRYKDTDFKLANAEGGQKGIMTAEVNHNPWQGIQFHSKFQWSTVAGEYFANYIEGGYAKVVPVPTVPGLNVRLYGALGYGALAKSSQPYTHVEGFVGKDFPGVIKNEATKTNINFNLNSTLRNYYFITDKKAFTTLEVNAGVNGQIIDRLNGYARQFERYDFGLGALGNNVYGIADGKARETYAGLSYRLDYGFGPVNLHTVQYDYGHLWYDLNSTNNRNELGATFRLNIAEPLRLDITPGYDWYWGGPSLTGAAMVRLPQASNAFGPSVKYNWMPNGAHRLSLGVVMTDKGN